LLRPRRLHIDYVDQPQAITATDPNNNTTTYSYDSAGKVVGVTDANNHTTSYAYDSMDRLATLTDALGHSTLYGYDSGGNQITVRDALGHTATTLYDALNRPTTITSAVSGTTTISYDAAGRQTGLTDPVGNQTQWAYDANDRMTTMTLPNGHTVTNVYDADGELTDTTDANGRRTTYSYNADGDQTGETWLNASGGAIDIITNSYDADNELTGASDSYATLTFTYDSGGNQLTAATSGPGSGQPSVTLTSGYDAMHDRTSLKDNLSSQGITTLVYDAGQRLTTITTSYGGTSGPQVVYTYDPANRMTSIVRTIAGAGTQVISSFNYDAANRQTTIIHQAYTPGSGGGTTTPLATYVYGYDNADRVTSEQDAEGTASFTYDNANELAGVTGSRNETYSYDANGNRNSSGYSTTTGNEQTASPGHSYTFDNAGNLISDTNTSSHVITTYTYDYRNRLTGVTVGGTVVATCTYDALDHRIGIKDNGTQTWTVYDGSSRNAHPYADFSGSGTLTKRYLYGRGVINGAVVDELLARTSSGASAAWYLPDKLGSVRDIVDGSGNALDHVVYDSFGNIVTETNASNGDQFKYAEMQFDPVIGIYYDEARFYSSTTGRFIRLDPLGFPSGDANLYRYVANSSTNYVDPSGEFVPLGWLAFMLFVSGAAFLGAGEYNPAGGEIGDHPSERGNPAMGMIRGVQMALWLVSIYHMVAGVAECVYSGIANGLGEGGLVGTEGTFARAADEAPTLPEGFFSIRDWSGYPHGVPRPEGPFRLLTGEEYRNARDTADIANRAMRAANPTEFIGKQIHEIHPLKFGGSPTDPANKVPLPTDFHQNVVTPWWNRMQRSIESGRH
jgi:RHS repeat-associated protein